MVQRILFALNSFRIVLLLQNVFLDVFLILSIHQIIYFI